MRTEAPAAAAQPEARDEDPRHKTTICRNWQAGYCKRGDKCGFAHGEEERREPPICRNWKTGYCKKGAKCAFTHAAALREPPAKKARTKPPESEEPPEPDGFNSQRLPMRATKSDCAQYRRTGVCPFLQRRKFDHPEWDPEQDNINNLERIQKALETAKRIADEIKTKAAAASSQTAASSRDEQSALPPDETAEATALPDIKSEAAWSASQKAEEEGTADEHAIARILPLSLPSLQLAQLRRRLAQLRRLLT